MRTLLEVVQGVLNSAGSDEVDSITDSTEAMTVAYIAKDCFTFLQAKSHPPDTMQMFNLQASGDPTKPTLMTRPDKLNNIEWVKYRMIDGDQDEWKDVPYLPWDEFLLRNYAEAKNSHGSYDFIGGSGDDMTIYYKNDQNPTYWSTFNDYRIFFDSYNASLESTLVSDKTLVYGRFEFDFTFDDSFIGFSHDSKLNEQWYNETKLQYHEDIRQATNAPAARRVKDMQISNQKFKFDTPGTCYGSPKDGLPNYGRRR